MLPLEVGGSSSKSEKWQTRSSRGLELWIVRKYKGSRKKRLEEGVVFVRVKGRTNSNSGKNGGMAAR